jgi:hypothetical protein
VRCVTSAQCMWSSSRAPCSVSPNTAALARRRSLPLYVRSDRETSARRSSRVHPSRQRRRIASRQRPARMLHWRPSDVLRAYSRLAGGELQRGTSPARPSGNRRCDIRRAGRRTPCRTWRSRRDNSDILAGQCCAIRGKRPEDSAKSNIERQLSGRDGNESAARALRDRPRAGVSLAG